MDRSLQHGTPANRTLSAVEAASLLGVNQRTVRRAIARGDLAARKVDGVYRIDRESLDAFQVARPPGNAASIPPLPSRPVCPRREPFHEPSQNS